MKVVSFGKDRRKFTSSIKSRSYSFVPEQPNWCFIFLSANQTDKVTKCWACQQNFSKDETRFAMHKHIVDELTVKEAIESVLPDECVTLQGRSVCGWV